MEKLFFVTKQETPREFTSNQGGEKIKAVDLHLSDGINQCVATAYDKKAQQLIDHPLGAGTLINADITLSIRPVKTQKGEEFSQTQVRLNNYGLFGAVSS